MTARLVIFASFASADYLPEYLRFHLKALRQFSSKLVYVSNSPLSEISCEQLGAICDCIHERSNLGFDFAAWRDVILSERMTEWDEVLLTNSSVVGPLFDLAPLFQDMQSRSCDFWGLTHSVNVRPHIQSYFVCFRKPLINSPVWQQFWRSVQDETSKRRVILRYETQFTSLFESHGFVSDTYLPQMQKSGLKRLFIYRYNTILPLFAIRDKNRTNATIHSPQELIEHGLPYLKASLLWGEHRRQRIPLKEIMELEKVDYDWSLVGL